MGLISWVRVGLIGFAYGLISSVKVRLMGLRSWPNGLGLWAW